MKNILAAIMIIIGASAILHAVNENTNTSVEKPTEIIKPCTEKDIVITNVKIESRDTGTDYADNEIMLNGAIRQFGGIPAIVDIKANVKNNCVSAIKLSLNYKGYNANDNLLFSIIGNQVTSYDDFNHVVRINETKSGDLEFVKPGETIEISNLGTVAAGNFRDIVKNVIEVSSIEAVSSTYVYSY